MTEKWTIIYFWGETTRKKKLKGFSWALSFSGEQYFCVAYYTFYVPI